MTATARRGIHWQWLAGLALLGAVIAAGRLMPLRAWIDGFGAWIAGLGPAGFVLYAAVYALGAVLVMPVFFMIIAAGYFFGLLPGVAVVSVGATLGAAAAFLIGRYVARERVARWAAKNPRYTAIDRAVGQKGWKIVFLLRLSPLVPYTLSNYFYGLTAVRFWPYVFASWIGMIPLTFLYVSFGVAGREAAVEAAGPPAVWKWTLLAVGVLVTLAATAYAGKIAREALAEAAGGKP
jgi:uncharacterized membrane protein YdjX (TVP38/TMEM64 family)